MWLETDAPCTLCEEVALGVSTLSYILYNLWFTWIFWLDKVLGAGKLYLYQVCPLCQVVGGIL